MISLEERQSEKWECIVLFRINIVCFSPFMSNYQVVLLKGEAANTKPAKEHTSPKTYVSLPEM